MSQEYDDIIPAIFIRLAYKLLVKNFMGHLEASEEKVIFGIDTEKEEVVLLDAEKETVIDIIRFSDDATIY